MTLQKFGTGLIELDEVLITSCNECGGEIKFRPFIVAGVRRDAGPGICNGCAEKYEVEQKAERCKVATVEYRIASGLPRHFERASWPIEETSAVDAARRWAAGDLRGIFLCGDVGVGKSYLAAAAALERMRWTVDANGKVHRGYRTAWLNMASIVQRARYTGTDDDAGRRAEAMAMVSGRGAAIIDDIDKVGTSDYSRELVFTAISNRYDNDAPLIVTSNKTPTELIHHLGWHGKAIASRLTEMCEMFVVEGPDRRKKRR